MADQAWARCNRDRRRAKDERQFADHMEILQEMALDPLDPKPRRVDRSRRRVRVGVCVRALQGVWAARYDSEAVDGTYESRQENDE